MGIIQSLLQNVSLPRMVKVYQRLPASKVENIPAAIKQEMKKAGVDDSIKPGMRIAIAVGSRGFASLPIIVKTVVTEIKARGGLPFVVPAMGSHGGATAEGQRQVLANLYF